MQKTSKRIALFLAASAVAIVAAWAAISAWTASGADERWGGLLSLYERQNAEIDPLAGGMVFIGSSSIRGWPIDVYFPEYTTLNRGLGGSRIRDLIQHLDILLAGHKPEMVVIYAGENDIDAGLSPDQVLVVYRTLIAEIRQRLPQVDIVLIRLKLAPSRTRLAKDADILNRLLEDWALDETFITLIGNDIRKNGIYVVDENIFRGDRLHLNEIGYQRWSEDLRNVLTSEPLREIGGSGP